MIPLPSLPTQHRRHAWRLPPSRSGLAAALSALAREQTGLLVVVCHDTHSAHALEAELGVLGRELPVLHFPDWETLPYDLFSPHPDIVSQRVETLYRLPTTRRGLLVVPVTTLMQRLPPPSFVAGSALMVAVGERLDLEAEKRRLESSGYRNVPQVRDPGEFAVRGALLDVFPMGAREPYRIELLDDTIDSIRSFDPDTQRSAQRVEAVRLLPAREFPLDEEATLRVRERLRETFDIDPRRCPLYQDLRHGVAPAGIEYYLPLFFDATATLFDYLPEDTLLALDAGALEAAERFWEQTGQRHEQRRHDVERPVLPPAALYLAPEPLRGALNRWRRVEFVAEGDPRHAEAAGLALAPAPELPWQPRADDPAAALRDFLHAYPGSVLLAADSPGRREALIERLAEHGLRPETVEDYLSWQDAGRRPRWAIGVAALEDGFAVIEPPYCVLTERQLFPERAAQPRRRRRAGTEPETLLRDLSEIAIGAPIVHEDHGVGRYQGLVTLDTGGAPGEFLCIEYAHGDKLYVPVGQLQRVSRYAGAADEQAPLHALGGEQWQKARRRAVEKIRDVAAELLEIQARRHARAGLAIPLDRTQYERFAAQFPFEETPDQLAAIEAVLGDLASSTPMDRVVCGDVGFGKTEVAVRAAFATAMAGRQVALLVPTTLLAEQHFRNFRDRFADWPIRVDVLSRFKTAAEIRTALAQLAEGRIDVIVGTHRLLQKDVRFRDLGLVIVDEEQRFGVRQKEALKALRAEVHLLTLTATPIPRTLHMAMSGLRDLSIIATPPQHRLAVETFVGPWDAERVREAFQRELARGGQVYYLYNEVESIERMARDLAELVPEARIRVAHGQMPERELEQVMLDFHRQRFNVLVCTTIIESGIDIPSANTILIHRADRFGLAQLHQLRGRVGRSHHRAYAYLLVPDRKSLTADAVKRLDALASLDALGAGFTLATHDLEIRGAGELLGEEQSGQIAEIGYTLYTQLLERAVRSIRQGQIPDLDLAAAQGAEVELHLPALIPDDYLPDVHTRLTLYKRIASAGDEEALRALQIEMIDRFGLLPEPVRNLFAVAALRQQAEALGILRLELGERGGRVQFHARPAIEPIHLIRLLQGEPKRYAMDGQDRLRIQEPLPEPSARLAFAQGLLARLAGRSAST
ncbi:MAG: transcription-repair-coupling factor [Lysobacteraceae bacterium]|nr:MAG: transcription-repair-coupling factor [Xanthomonadaceae bacterium]